VPKRYSPSGKGASGRKVSQKEEGGGDLPRRPLTLGRERCVFYPDP
jgi:hypothetical protein